MSIRHAYITGPHREGRRRQAGRAVAGPGRAFQRSAASFAPSPTSAAPHKASIGRRSLR